MNQFINISKIFHNSLKVVLLAILLFGVLSFVAPQNSYALFEELTAKGAEIFTGMRDIIYVVAGFGIVGIAIGGFFGNLNWKWLGAIIIGLMIIAMTAAFIQYVSGEELQGVTDTLK
ncbi:MAG: hypothetical protein IJX20_02160 [Alphaproteobacteria bacterium]|nr:hypothetical protein [Alphaproteobacteria bacterium]